MSFKNKVVIVTGGSNGIGAATAIILAREGASVVIVGRNETKLNNIASKCGEVGKRAFPIKADVTKDEDLATVLNRTIDTFGKLDVLINNAGIWRRHPIMMENVGEAFTDVFNTNFRAPLMLTHLAVPYLEATKGNIVNVSSVLASVPLNGYSVYCASKAALAHFSKTIAVELATKGVRVNTVSPGPVQTDLFKTSGDDVSEEFLCSFTLTNKMVMPEDVGELIAYLASDRAKFITGSDYLIDNGVTVKK